MDEQSMLPFHIPISPAKRFEVVDRPPRRTPRTKKPLDAGFMAALADPARVVFLDVETTGLSWYYDYITIVGWMRDGSYDFHVTGEPITRLARALQDAAALVTFNGTLFDLRFLRKEFAELVTPPLHVDLRYLAKRADLSGGQKVIERLLGLPQRTNAMDVDGAEAVLLWHRYLRGDKSSLRQLIEYNRYDVLGMCGILDQVLERLEPHPDLWVSHPKFFRCPDEPVAASAASSALPVRRNARSNTFRQVFAGTAAESASVVGIDLTSSRRVHLGGLLCAVPKPRRLWWPLMTKSSPELWRQNRRLFRSTRRFPYPPEEFVSKTTIRAVSSLGSCGAASE